MAKWKGFMQEVFARARAELERAGFKPRVHEIYTRALDADAVGWVGLNNAFDSHARVLRINPVIGVRYQPVERLVAEMCGLKFHAYVPPTVTIPLGYLMPEDTYRTWDFQEGEELHSVAASMACALTDYGLPFMTARAAPEALTATLRDRRFQVGEQAEYRIPALLYLLGREEEAKAYLRERLTALSTANYPAADFYRNFAHALLDLIT
jgi:hypothetical protein